MMMMMMMCLYFPFVRRRCQLKTPSLSPDMCVRMCVCVRVCNAEVCTCLRSPRLLRGAFSTHYLLSLPPHPIPSPYCQPLSLCLCIHA